MAAADNRELIGYYSSRRVWLVEPDASPARVSPYPAAEIVAPAAVASAGGQGMQAAKRSGGNAND
jgi:hypothetical protein